MIGKLDTKHFFLVQPKVMQKGNVDKTHDKINLSTLNLQTGHMIEGGDIPIPPSLGEDAKSYF